jgi:hypothetical protein
MLLYGKKGYIRTLEIMIAFVLTFSFVGVNLQQSSIQSNNKNVELVLKQVLEDNEFRNELLTITGNCVKRNENISLTNRLDKYIENEYILCIDKKPSLEKKEIQVQSFYFSGLINNTNSSNEVKLYTYS